MKKIYSLLLLFSFICVMPSTSANYGEGDETENNSQIEITSPEIEAVPGEFLYYWVSFKRKIKSIITIDAKKQAELDLRIADEMIAEVQILLENGDQELIAKHIARYNKLIGKMHKRNEKLSDKYPNVAEDYEEKLSKSTQHHLAIITMAEEDLPPELLEIAQGTNLSILGKIKLTITNTAIKVKTKIVGVPQSAQNKVNKFTIDRFDGDSENYATYRQEQNVLSKEEKEEFKEEKEEVREEKIEERIEAKEEKKESASPADTPEPEEEPEKEKRKPKFPSQANENAASNPSSDKDKPDKKVK